MREMERSLEKQQHAQAVRDADAQLHQMDSNKDGVVDGKEFAAAGGSSRQFDRYDVNGDGVLDAEELAKRSAAQAHAASETRVMDTNKDGLVDEEEFLAAGWMFRDW